MSDKPRVAVRNAGAFLAPDMGGGGGLIGAPMNSLSVGPGEPGPEDEWKMPLGPVDEIVAEDEAVPEPAHEGLLHRLTHKS